MNIVEKTIFVNDLGQDVFYCMWKYFGELLDINKEQNAEWSSSVASERFSDNFKELFGIRNVELSISNEQEEESTLLIKIEVENGIFNTLYEREKMTNTIRCVLDKEENVIYDVNVRGVHGLAPIFFSDDGEDDDTGKPNISKVFDNAVEIKELHDTIKTQLGRGLNPFTPVSSPARNERAERDKNVIELYRYLFDSSCDREALREAFVFAKLKNDLQPLFDVVAA